ncbi:MAG: M20/M25/M40 family metallo-hydrolase, partial [Gammaproteobacteria bacterium]|nr:M20/M25/M40 family metallo-hydrolase [Gammaproteobacteria bacterium]
FQQAHPDVRVLLDRGRYLAVQLSGDEARKIGTHLEPCFVIRPLRENTVIFDQPAPAAARSAPVAWVQDLVASVSHAHYRAAVEHLVSLPTRYSTSDHYAAAAKWCRTRLEVMGYDARLQTITVGNLNSHNVIADKPGSGPGTRKLVLLVAHLDSINIAGGPAAAAPGADDNGSGCAAVLAIARSLKDHRAVHDLRFILFGGEEQGLHGSSQYVAGLDAAERGRIQAVVNMDMVGSLNTLVPTVLLEGDAVSRDVIQQLADAAATYTSLNVQTSLNPFASDHVPFIEAGLPAVLTIEGADGANGNIHSANDLLDHLDDELTLETIRMNLGFMAAALGRQGDRTMTDCQQPSDPAITQFSGRFSHNGGAGRGRRLSAREVLEQPRAAVRDNPIYDLNQPIYRPETARRRDEDSASLTLHIDIDGIDPLAVVSGTVAVGDEPPRHFIGRVTDNTVSSEGRRLVVQDMRLNWPGSGDTIQRVEIDLVGPTSQPQARVNFIAAGQQFGPFEADRESPFFRDVEFEIDREDGAVEVEPFNTLTHPDRPADLVEEDLTLENTFAKSGIRVRRSSQGNVIATSEAGPNNRWNELELHDAMDSHWSAFANRPQWKMWIFIAELADSDGLGGIMFDGNIDEPGGVDRQGTALFTKAPFFHSVNGAYIRANPPEAEAVERELFFNLIHESGHAFNLAHSFQKTLGAPWHAPNWSPMQSDSQALSWMNYPDSASPGLNATWFYERFRFRFDDSENLFLRHAPERFVQMGDEDWFENHGRVSRGSLDPRLQLTVRGRKAMMELGEPVVVELKLKNISDEPIPVHTNLAASDGYVELAVTNPKGERRPFVPFAHTRVRISRILLESGEAIYEPVKLILGQFGCPFKQPGPYRIEASYTNIDGGTAAAIMQLWVKPPAHYDDWPTIAEFFNARVGRVLEVGGSRVMQDVNDRLEWIGARLDTRHPTQHHLAKVFSAPLVKPFKLLTGESDRIALLDPDPERVQRTLQPVVDDTATAADSIGHIEFRRVVDAYTECALQTRKRAAARKAQESLVGVFKERRVVKSVIESIERRIGELK